MVPERKHLPSCVGCTGLVDVGLPQGWGYRRDAHGTECLGEVEQSCERSGQTVGSRLTLDE